MRTSDSHVATQVRPGDAGRGARAAAPVAAAQEEAGGGGEALPAAAEDDEAAARGEKHVRPARNAVQRQRRGSMLRRHSDWATLESVFA